MPKPEDIIFIETDTSWVHHPPKDALVIIAKIANSLIHRGVNRQWKRCQYSLLECLPEDLVKMG